MNRYVTIVAVLCLIIVAIVTPSSSAQDFDMTFLSETEYLTYSTIGFVVREGYLYQGENHPITATVKPLHAEIGTTISISASNGPFGKYFVRPYQTSPLKNIDGTRTYENSCCIDSYTKIENEIEVKPNAGYSTTITLPSFEIVEGTFNSVVHLDVIPSY